MNTGFGILSFVTFLPLLGALAIATLNKDAKGNARWIALYFTLATFGASLYLWVHFDPTNAGLPVRRGDGAGWAGPSTTRWASTASPCCSWC